MYKNTFLLLLSLFTLLLSCNREPNILGTWEIESLEVGEEKLTGEDLDNPYYIFKADNTYMIQLATVNQTGTWEIEDKIIYLNNDVNPEIRMKMNILELTDAIFHYSVDDGKLLTDVVLKKVK